VHQWRIGEGHARDEHRVGRHADGIGSGLRRELGGRDRVGGADAVVDAHFLADQGEGDDLKLIATLKPEAIKRIQEFAIKQNTTTLHNRINELGDTEALLRDHGVRAILGKGGLSQRSTELMRQYGACYLSVTGGAAAMETLQIEEIEAVYWEDLMPESIWQFRVKAFGPWTVGIDAKGRNLQDEVQSAAKTKMGELLAKMGVK